MALGMGLPSTILGLAYGCYYFYQRGFLSKTLSILIFLSIVGGTLAMMVHYVQQYKRKS